VVDYVKVNGGAWNLAASWDIGVGWPSSGADTASMANYDTEIPVGVSITCGAITMTGTSAISRTRLNLNGSLEITADMTLNSWNEFNIAGGAVLELGGNDVLFTSNVGNRNRLVWIGTSLSRVKVRSSIAGSGRIHMTGVAFQCHVDMDYIDFVDIAGLGGDWNSRGIGDNFTFTAGETIRLEHFTFTGCGASAIGGNLHANATQIIRYGDIRNPSTSSYSLHVVDTNEMSLGTGTIALSHITFDSDATNKGLRLGTRRLPAMEVMVFSNTPYFAITVSGHDPDVTDSFFHINAGFTGTSIAEGASGSCVDSYVIHEKNNPKPFNAIFSEITRPVMELVWTDSYTDDGDLCILSPSSPLTVSHGLVLDEKSCVLGNALGSAMADIYNFFNCTLVGNYDAAYGSIFRTESGGSVTGTLNLTNTIIYNKTPVVGSLGFNFDAAVPADDQVTSMDSQCWYQIDDKYHGVTSATKTAGVTVGYGGNDIEEDPEFFDVTRSAANWDLTQGLGVGTVASVVADMLNINGYDDATKSQIAANASPRRPIDLHAWVRDGYRTTNVLLANTGEGGVTIGAMEYVSTDGSDRLLVPLSVTKTPVVGLLTSYGRAGSATYIDSSGVVQTALSNVERIPDINGLLIEPLGQNTLLHSEDEGTTWATWGSTGLVVTLDADTSPDGTLTADQLTQMTSPSNGRGQLLTLASSSTYTVSRFFKTVNSGRSRLFVYDHANFSVRADLEFTWTAGVPSTFSASGISDITYTAVSGGYYRVSYRYTTLANITTHTIVTNPERSVSAPNSVYVWGAQNELGSLSTYIPTAAATVTRNADDLIYEWPALDNDYTIAIIVKPTAANQGEVCLWSVGAFASNYVSLWHTGTAFEFRVRTGGVDYVASFTSAMTNGTTYTIECSASSSSGLGIIVNAVAGSGNVSTADVLPANLTLRTGSAEGGTDYFTGQFSLLRVDVPGGGSDQGAVLQPVLRAVLRPVLRRV